MRLELAAEATGERLDRVLCAELGASRAEVKRWFASCLIRVNGRPAVKSQLASEGDVVELDEPLRDLTAAAQPQAELAVRYEDADFVIVDKPAGQPCHPLRAGELGCLANALVARYPEMAGVGFDVRQPGLINRLDNDTSGLVLAARHSAAFVGARQLFARHEVAKRYLAVSTALPSQPSIETGLAPSPRSGRRVECVEQGPRYLTRIDVCWPRGPYFWLWLTVHTAYRHQIRVHLAQLGAPLLGDRLYGGAPHPAGAGHALHAAALRFCSPFGGHEIAIDTPAPAAFPGSADQKGQSTPP